MKGKACLLGIWNLVWRISPPLLNHWTKTLLTILNNLKNIGDDNMINVTNSLSFIFFVLVANLLVNDLILEIKSSALLLVDVCC